MEDSEDEGARSEPEGRAAERERAAAIALTRSRQPCLRRKSRKLKQEEEPEDFYLFVFLWFMKAIYLQLMRTGQVFNDAESSCEQFLGPTCICSLTHIVTTVFLPHLSLCGTLNSFFGSSNVGSTLCMQSPMGGGHS